jgi:hypothetical protein
MLNKAGAVVMWLCIGVFAVFLWSGMAMIWQTSTQDERAQGIKFWSKAALVFLALIGAITLAREFLAP